MKRQEIYDFLLDSANHGLGSCGQCLEQNVIVFSVKDFPEDFSISWLCFDCLLATFKKKPIYICTGQRCQSITYRPQHRPFDTDVHNQDLLCKSCAADYDFNENLHNLSLKHTKEMKPIYSKALRQINKLAKKYKVKIPKKKGGEKK